MTIVLTSPKPVSIPAPGGGRRFLKPNVPTWVADAHAKRLIASGVAEAFDAQRHSVSLLDGEDVLIYAPQAFELYIASLYAIERIQRTHPSCLVSVVARREFSLLRLPKTAMIDAPKAKQYYRTFDMRESKNDYYFSQHSRRNVPWEYLCLAAAGLIDYTSNDKSGLSNGLPLEGVSAGGAVVVPTQGFTRSPVMEQIAGALTERYNNNENVKVIGAVTPFAEQIAAVLAARAVVSPCDSPLAYLSACLGKKTFILYNADYHSFWERQTAHRANVRWTTIQNISSVESCVNGLSQIIADSIGGEITPAPPRRSSRRGETGGNSIKHKGISHDASSDHNE